MGMLIFVYQSPETAPYLLLPDETWNKSKYVLPLSFTVYQKIQPFKL